jgi:transposase
MGWFRVRLSNDEQRVVLDHRECHVDLLVRQRMWALWLLHCGETREKAAEILQVSRATVQRYVGAYRTGGLAGVMSRGDAEAVSAWTPYDEVLKAEFLARPARSVAEAGERIQALTGLKRGPTQIRHHLHRLGLEYRRMRAIPAPPKKSLKSTSPFKPPLLSRSCSPHSPPPSRAEATSSSWMPATS